MSEQVVTGEKAVISRFGTDVAEVLKIQLGEDGFRNLCADPELIKAFAGGMRMAEGIMRGELASQLQGADKFKVIAGLVHAMEDMVDPFSGE